LFILFFMEEGSPRRERMSDAVGADLDGIKSLGDFAVPSVAGAYEVGKAALFLPSQVCSFLDRKSYLQRTAGTNSRRKIACYLAGALASGVVSFFGVRWAINELRGYHDNPWPVVGLVALHAASAGYEVGKRKSK
jgi:hypothetical protein